jgi:hypothetical protein
MAAIDRRAFPAAIAFLSAVASQSKTPSFVAIWTVVFSVMLASRLTSFLAIVCVIGNLFSTAATIIFASDFT